MSGLRLRLRKRRLLLGLLILFAALGYANDRLQLQSPSVSEPMILHDPTEPPNSAVALNVSQETISEQTTDGLTIQMIVISAKRRYALVNGRIIQVGDQLAGKKVVAIRTHGIVLRTEGGKQVLPFIADTTKQPVSSHNAVKE